MPLIRILVVDDEPDMLRACSNIINSINIEGTKIQVDIESSSKDAAVGASASSCDIVILDLKMEEMDGVEVMRRIKKEAPDMVVILMTGFPTLETAYEGTKMGAYDYITKPFTAEQLSIAVIRAIEYIRLREENRMLRQRVFNSYSEQIIAESKTMKDTLGLARRIAAADGNVLITGETGTGKSIMAKFIHEASQRSKRSFVQVDCGALSETLMESELFGHEKGAFTGATANRKGLIEYANDGTIFLDEICNLSFSTQSKLLGVLQERAVRPIGRNESIPVNVRVIAATNKHVEQEVKAGRFREDLYYRLKVLHLQVPPLREHSEDISFLVARFIEQFDKRNGKKIAGLTGRAEEVLKRYLWPGNIRQLMNVCEYACSITQNDYIDIGEIGAEILSSSINALPEPPESSFVTAREKALSDFESHYFRQLLESTGGNVTQAAKQSGLGRNTLYRYLKKYDIRS